MGADTHSRSLYITEHPDVSGPFAQAIMAGQIMIGMTPEMIEAAWGVPQRVEHRNRPPAEGKGEASTETKGEVTPTADVKSTGEAGSAAQAALAKAASRRWDLKLVYGNYLVNSMVSNLYFEGGKLKIIENVDTNGASTLSIDDPNLRLLLPGQPPPGSGPVKGGQIN